MPGCFTGCNIALKFALSSSFPEPVEGIIVSFSGGSRLDKLGERPHQTYFDCSESVC